MSDVVFPAGFVWGSATSSYQVEGAWDCDGRSESIWDRFSHTPGHILDQSTGDVACDHYHRFPEDIQVMSQLGLHSYRFSISWPRILPEGRGRVNQAGVDFYKRLVYGLLEAKITPVATLYHWDLPQVLQERGGWPSRIVPEAFAEYADVITRELGDLVKMWSTINEPWCVSFLSHQIGEHAPGMKDWQAAIRASHHTLLAHGWAVPLIRRNSPGAQVGIVLNFTPATPASHSWYDVEATRRADGYSHRWFLDPLYGRGYPTDVVADFIADGHLPNRLDFIEPDDLAAIAAPTDYLGINYYTRAIVRSDRVSERANAPQTVPAPTPDHLTDIGWEVHPPTLYQLLTRLHFEYNPGPIYIMENGAAYHDGPNGDGAIHDQRRVAYLQSHLTEVHRAIQSGVPVAGYFVWSLLDNFEWAHGYGQRFGIVHVDFTTQQRRLKDSALWYREVVQNNMLP